MLQQSAVFVFILGRYSELSVQEIVRVLSKQGISFKVLQQSKQVALVETKDDFEVESVNKTLGGTVKIAKVQHSIALPFSKQSVDAYLSSDQFLLDFFGDVVGRIHFGISFYLCGGKEHIAWDIRKKIYSWTELIKDVLTGKNVVSRFPKKEGDFLSSVSVVKNKLLSDGAEVLMVLIQDKIVFAKTLAVQEFEAFSTRDYGRPVRDMRSGVMPPKLARMMLNIAQCKNDGVLLDPFCGSGTMLQEACLLGYHNIFGTDISEKAVIDSKKNLAWLEKQYMQNGNTILVEKYDVTKLAERFESSSVDAIVTEPYLGPNVKQRLSMKEIQSIQDQLRQLFVKAWKQFGIILRPNGVVVMILPVHNAGRHFVHMQILEDIVKTGFTQIPLSQNPRKSLLIGDTHDYVLREIVEFKKTIPTI